jgi:hypothetical protein
MKLRLLIFFLLCALSGCETSSREKIANQFKTYYNQNDYSAIYALYSPGMKHAFTAATTDSFYAQLQRSAGSLLSMKYKEYAGAYGLYEAEFQNGTYIIRMVLDNENKIGGLSIKPHIADSGFSSKRNETSLQLPFKGVWTVMWGGDTRKLNHHFDWKAQHYAFDMLITDSTGSTHKSDGKSNDDYYAFGKEIIAPCDGQIAEIADGVNDNVPGEMNGLEVAGNHVILKTAANEFILFGHLKRNSIRVTEDQRVKTGELLGLCGNSGNSSEPHLHFQIQSNLDMNKAEGIKCFFKEIMVNGSERLDYSPVKGDRIE